MISPTIPKAVEYAIKVLVCLALAPGSPVPASQVARITRIPSAQAAKILHYLGWRGLTRARRGPHGGYELCESPEEIRVGEVTRLFRPDAGNDSKLLTDPVLRIWMEKFSQRLKDWEELTIAELSRRTAGQWKFPARGKDRGNKT